MSDVAVKVRISADTSGYAKAVKDAQRSTQTLGTQMKKTEGFATRFGSQLQVAGVAGAAALGALALASVKAASDLAESENAINKAFGSASKDVLALGDDAAESFGMSENAFRQFAVRFSGFAKQISQSSGASIGDTLDDITTRIADFASVMNMSLEDASLVWSQSLAGETEAARRFGIDVSDAAVKAYALANGIGTAGKELTNNEKVLARQGILMQQTAQYAGDFADTADGLANQQRILAAKFEDAKAKLGESLLPVMTDAVGAANRLLDAFTGLPKGVQSGTLAVAAFGAALLLVAPRILQMAESLKVLRSESKLTAASLGKGGLYGALAALAAAQIATTTDEITSLSDAIDGVGGAKSVDDARASIQELQKQIDRTTDTSIWEMASGVGMLDETWARLSGSLGDAESQIGEAENAIRGFYNLTNGVAAATGASAKGVQQLAVELGLFGDESEWAREQLEAAVAEQQAGKSSAGQLADATETLSDATASAADQAKAYEDSLKSLNDTVLGITDAEIAFEASIDDLTASVKENGRSLDLGTEAGRANAKVLTDLARNARDAAQAEYDNAVAQGDAANATDRANGVYAAHTRQIDAVVKATGLSRERVETLIGAYNRVPDFVGTTVAANTGPAQRALDRFIRDNNGRPINLLAKISQGGLSVPGQQRAAGGYITGPGSGTSDSIPAWLSNGEFVVRASSVDKYGTSMLHAINAGRFASGGMVGRPVPGRAAGVSYAVTVNVAGSVATERDLVRSVRDGLVTLQTRGDRT